MEVIFGVLLFLSWPSEGHQGSKTGQVSHDSTELPLFTISFWNVSPHWLVRTASSKRSNTSCGWLTTEQLPFDGTWEAHSPASFQTRSSGRCDRDELRLDNNTLWLPQQPLFTWTLTITRAKQCRFRAMEGTSLSLLFYRHSIYRMSRLSYWSSGNNTVKRTKLGRTPSYIPVAVGHV